MSRRGWAWVLGAVTAAGVAVQVALLLAAGVPLISGEALTRTFPIVPVAVLIGAVVGALIVGRHPRHPIGWLFCIGQAGAAIGLAAQTLGSAVTVHDLGPPVAVGQWAWWVGSLLGARYALTLVAVLLLLVPDGRLPSPRWRPLLAFQVAAYGLGIVALLITPPSQLTGDIPGPPADLFTRLIILSELGLTLGLLGAAAALVIRLRRARGEERQQLRWIAVAGFTLTAAVTVAFVVGHVRGGPSPPYVQTAFLLGYLAVPVATGFAVLRHRLYDIDVIIGSAVRLAVLAGFVTAGYVAAVVAIGTVLGGSGATVWASVLAYALVALAFQPLRRQVDRIADRIVYGTRAAPYDSLAEFSRQLGASRSDPQVLVLTAHACAEVVGAQRAVVRVSVPGATDLTARWPTDDGPTPTTFVPVAHGGEVLGEIGLSLPPGRSLTTAQRRLLGEFAAQDALAFRNLALTAALQARATELARRGEELAASRRRLVDAADTERARVAAAIQREVLAHVEPIPDVLAGLDPAEPAAVRRGLEQSAEATEAAIEALRVITGGVFPPLLARRGLAAALRSFARQSAAQPSLTIGEGMEKRRFPAPVEAAVYFCCVEAVRARRPGAKLAVDMADDRLIVTVHGRLGQDAVADQALLDRVEVLGGQVRVEPLDEASVLRVEIPLASDQDATNRSEPNADLVTYTSPVPAVTSASVSSS